ncbi:putative protein rds1 [Glarea lozoyensis 74030]|uniref:Ferritin-like protein n=1 Tax=Glarea lozoyensis (strain ATCC 74030 / MF5533) TaxID=1104152 RepID=H0EKV8_GLAL7|nr:putative protein rds1 [Glarea lozoyensis 74030]
MQYRLPLITLAAITLVTASPVVTKRDITDIEILNYALTLEHLEDKFYREGLANYTQADFVAAGFADPFYANLKEISYDETTHVGFLTKALGDAAVKECTYSFPSTDPKSFVALASVLEGVGTTAGSILTVEARHNAYIRAAKAQAPFPSPFDAPLTFNEVYTLAAGFIVSCPSTNGALPFKAFPGITLVTTGPLAAGTEIVLQTPGYVLQGADGSSNLYAAFIMVTGGVFAEAIGIDGGFKVVIPEGVNGQVYVVLTGCSEGPITDDNVGAGPAILEITNPYPTVV